MWRRHVSVAGKVLQQSSPPTDPAEAAPKRRSFWTLSRLWDLLAVLVVLFVVWKWFIAPRSLDLVKAVPAPHVTYALLDGGSFALAQQRGHTVFLDFWATWCTPCRLSLPLVEGYARAHPNVDIVAVNMGEPEPAVAAFSKQYGMSKVAMDPQSLSTGFFQLQGYPTMVVIDPQGRIRATWMGFNPAIAANMENAREKLDSGG